MQGKHRLALSVMVEGYSVGNQLLQQKKIFFSSVRRCKVVKKEGTPWGCVKMKETLRSAEEVLLLLSPLRHPPHLVGTHAVF